MSDAGGIFERLEGLAWWGVMIIAGWIALSGPVDRIFAAEQNLYDAEYLSYQHASRLKRPVALSEALRFKSYVLAADAEVKLDSSAIQSALITLVKDHRAKLVDLRVLQDDIAIESLIARRFRLDIEGDLIAVLDVLKGLGGFDQPVLIDNIALSPVGQQDRPDRRLRASFELSFWEEDGAQ